MTWLSGKKTYIGLIASFVLALLGIFGVVQPTSEVFQLLAAAILTFTGVAYREAIQKAPSGE